MNKIDLSLPNGNLMAKLFKGSRLKLLRERRGLSQDQLAKSLKTTQKQISRYETGKRYPTDRFLAKLVEFFNSNSSYFHGEIDYQAALPDDASKLLDAVDGGDSATVDEILRNRARQIRDKRRNASPVNPQIASDTPDGT